MEVLDRVPTLAPTPDGQPLEIRVRCSVDRSHRKSYTHPVTIHPDWTVTTPHDLEVERIGVAMGGYLSCIDLVDNCVPAARLYLIRQLRLETPQLSLGKSGRWLVAERVDTCCAGSPSYRSPMDAAEHLRSPRHCAARHRSRPRVVAQIGEALLQAHGGRDPMPLPPRSGRLVGTCVDRQVDLRTLWDAGVPLDVVEQIHQRASDGRVLPVSFYFGVLTNRPDLTWVRETAAEAPERELHDWLAWTVSARDRDQPGLRGEWLALGVSRRDIGELQHAGYEPSDVARLAALLDASGTQAAAVLAGWVRADCRPDTAELGRVYGLSAQQSRVPSAASIERLRDLLSSEGIAADRLEAGYALLICGTASIAKAVVTEVGALAPDLVAKGLTDWESRPRKKECTCVTVTTTSCC